MKKRMIRTVLVAISMVFMICIDTYAASIEDQIKSDHSKALQIAGVSNFTNQCDDYVYYKLRAMGIFSSSESYSTYNTNGNNCYNVYSKINKTSTGYTATKYSGSSALDTLSSNGTKDVYNIVVSYHHQYNYTDSNPGAGHVLLIHAIKGGYVYLSENYTYSGIAQGQPLKIAYSSFKSSWNSMYGYTMGAVVFTKNNAPSVSGVKVTSSGGGAKLEFDVQGNGTSISSVTITAWSLASNQGIDKAKSYSPTSSSGSHYTFQINISDFNYNTGSYKSNIFVNGKIYEGYRDYSYTITHTHQSVTVAGKSATCTMYGLTEHRECKTCGYNLSIVYPIDPLGHSWNSGVITKAAKCTTDGVKTYTCSRCGATKTETIKATGHKTVEISSVEASCTTDGLSAGSKCSSCGEILVPQEVTTKALGHNWEEIKNDSSTGQNIEEKQFKCTRCGIVRKETDSNTSRDNNQNTNPTKENSNSSNNTTDMNNNGSGNSRSKNEQTSNDKTDNNSGGNINLSDNSDVADNPSSSSSGEETGGDNASNVRYSSEWVDGKWYDADGNQNYEGSLMWKSNSVGWWVEDSSGWYPISCWQKIDSKWYYFDASGYIVTNSWQDGCWLGSSGAWDYEPEGSWNGNSEGWWFSDTTGWYAHGQWLKINCSWYYFDTSGYMVTSKYIDGYWIGADGVCH